MEGWLVASKGLAALSRRRGSALSHGCGRGGRVALPLARAAAVSTSFRVLPREEVLARGDDLADLDVEALEVVDRLREHHGALVVLVLPQHLARLLVQTLAEKPLASLVRAP